MHCHDKLWFQYWTALLNIPALQVSPAVLHLSDAMWLAPEKVVALIHLRYYLG